MDPKEVKEAMRSLGFDQKSPVIFNVVSEMSELKGRIDFEIFMSFIRDRLGSEDTEKGLNRIFELYDDDNTQSININNLKRVAKELGETMNE